ncbi:hydrogenase [Candidatus Poribacteria bacterium]|nr:hydrogenase [Candidatus Poribacteria bacterium]
MNNPLPVYNGEAVGINKIPIVPPGLFLDSIVQAANDGARIACLFGSPVAARTIRLYAVLVHDPSGELSILATYVTDRYPALTPDCVQAHWFEREIAEQWGVRPEGHLWLKPVRFHHSYRPEHDAWGRSPNDPILPSVMDFFRVEGEETHEVAVGPVHAGVIEPGHFRFQCHGENVMHLEISLGYQHRGIERALQGGPDKRTIHFMETLAGDSTIGHATAYCGLVESLTHTQVPARAQMIRGIAAELERVANHVGDLGALAGDVGFLPTQNYCGRIRGDVLNLTALLCGNRFGRGLLVPGGVAWDLDPDRAGEMMARLEAIEADLAVAIPLMFDAPSVLARLEGTGSLSIELARRIGMVGGPARACGLVCDVRTQLPYGAYRFATLPVSTYHTGDCFARAYVRWLEVQRSFHLTRQLIESLTDGPLTRPCGALDPDQLAVALTEGWRGEICHVAATDEDGRFLFYKVVDPSFHNWFGLALAMRNQQISDFPLCNKSFNLSYCGHDL